MKLLLRHFLPTKRTPQYKSHFYRFLVNMNPTIDINRRARRKTR
jgi:hypothetical protein